MNKIPFDIKYRPEIEAGKYKVVTKAGQEVKIVCWDADEYWPIVGIVLHSAVSYRKNGSRSDASRAFLDLFLVPAEPELTEFEKALGEFAGFAISGGQVEPNMPTAEFVKGFSAKLLNLARKELGPEKDLPRWKKCDPCDKDDATIPAWIVRFDAELAGESAVVHNGHYILFGELEKLPKEE